MSIFRYKVRHKNNPKVTGETRTLHVNCVTDLKEEKAKTGETVQKVIVREIARVSLIWDDNPQQVMFEDPKNLVLIDELTSPVLDFSQDDDDDTPAADGEQEATEEASDEANKNIMEAVEQLIDSDKLGLPTSITKKLMVVVMQTDESMESRRDRVMELLANHPDEREILIKTFELAGGVKAV